MTAMIHFTDRHNAGQRLAMALGHLHGRDPVVLGLAPGGVLVAEAVAHALDAPLDVMVIQDIEAPLDPRVLIAATAPDASYVDTDEVRRLGVTQQFLSNALVRATWEARTRDALYRGDRPPLPLEQRIVVLVDDGTATSVTMRAAIASIRRHQPQELIVAAPVRCAGCEHIGTRVDAFACLSHAAASEPISDWYDTFPPVSDDQVMAALGATTLQLRPNHG